MFSESLVERNQSVSGGFHECRQICVGPEIRARFVRGNHGAPGAFDNRRLGHENDAIVCAKCFHGSPGALGGADVLSHDPPPVAPPYNPHPPNPSKPTLPIPPSPPSAPAPIAA